MSCIGLLLNVKKGKKRRSSAGKPYKDTLFTTSLAKSGVGLSDGSLQNTIGELEILLFVNFYIIILFFIIIDVDVSEFQRVLLATLTNHQPDFNQVNEVIKTNEIINIHSLLMVSIIIINNR